MSSDSDLYFSDYFMQSSSVDIRKQATNRKEADRLAHEATVLRLAAHPNVVEVGATRLDDDYGTLRINRVDATALAECHLEARSAGSVIMSAAATLAYLHQLDIAHNRLDATHILVRSDDTAVLCGFASATLNADDDAKSKDVIALGTLLRNSVGVGQDTLRDRINGVVSADADLAVSLSSVADIAIAGDMPAVELAESLRNLLEVPPAAVKPRRARRLPRWWELAAAAIIPIALVAFGVSSLSGQRGKAVATTPTTRVAPCPHHPRGAILVDTDNDGCPNTVYLGAGVVTVDGERFAVGNPSDHLLLGDWHGTGIATVALLRPSTGQIFVFDRWPSRRQSAKPVLVATLPGATDIATQRSGHHDVLAVTTPRGEVTIDPQTSTTTTVIP